MTQQAFVLRMSPSGIDRLPEALNYDQIIIGWSKARGLLDKDLEWNAFREVLSDAYYSEETTLRKAGAAAGHMWRFVRDMQEGDLVVVPYDSNFYVARVKGQAFWLEEKTSDDTAYRRDVEWLLARNPVPRSHAKSALLSRMKTQGTCAWATDLLPEIEECISLARTGAEPSFRDDLEARLVRETVDELRSGRLDSYKFELLICTILRQLGAIEAEVVPRSRDKGADIVATFFIAGAFQQVVAIQAKHWQPDPPVGEEVVKQLITGIEAESATLGMVITSGVISDEAAIAAETFFTESGIKIELVDGEQFAKLIVEHGVGES